MGFSSSVVSSGSDSLLYDLIRVDQSNNKGLKPEGTEERGNDKDHSKEY